MSEVGGVVLVAMDDHRDVSYPVAKVSHVGRPEVFDLEVWKGLSHILNASSLGSLDVLEGAGCPQAGMEVVSLWC